MRIRWESFRVLRQPLVQKRAQSPKRRIVEPAIGYELREQSLGRPAEELSEHSVYRARARVIPIDQRGITMCAPLDFSRDVPLFLQHAQQCKDRRIRRSVAECVSHLSDCTWPALPEHGHELDLPWGQP